MGWHAYLIDDRGHNEGDWEYTHNCNGMANVVLDDNYEQRSVAEEVFGFEDSSRVSWWRHLDGLPGPAGRVLLDRIVRGLEADPERFRVLNPENGWGDYDSLVAQLRQMRDSVPDWPTTWKVYG